jgi:hypothetical protein
MGDVQSMIMVNPIAVLAANLLAMPKVCFAEVGDRRRGHSVQIWVERYQVNVVQIGNNLLMKAGLLILYKSTISA